MKLELKNLSKSFDGKAEVLKDINLSDEVRALALIGSSGCGKSTLLRILGGLIPASSGEALLDGMRAETNVKYRKRIGFVFQNSGLFLHMNALDNITLPLIKVHGMSKEAAAGRAEELISRFGLSHEAHKMPAQLSGGQKQRVSIARAIAPKPEIILLDEPTSALDPEYTTEVLNMIGELRDENLSFIIATHEMGFALHACDKLAFLHGGGIAEYGGSAEIFAHPKTEKLQSFLSKILEWKA